MEWNKEFIKLEKYQKEGANNDFYHQFDLKYMKDLTFIYNTKLKELLNINNSQFKNNNGQGCEKLRKQISLLRMELGFLNKVIEIKSKNIQKVI